MSGNVVHLPQKLGPYELVRLLATGGMAEVYLARRDGPHGFSKTVALKRILPQLASDQDFVAMFVDEARVCAQLSHPNLVQVFDFGEASGELYMAMEYVDGTTCARAVRKAAALGETVTVDASLYVALSVLRGLEYAHAAVDHNGVPLGLVHRDVSPGNILLARSGAVKLGDFGIARADDFEQRTEEGQLKGKLGYMSPEQVTARKLDARSDLFTLGIVLAEILVARPLFGTGNELDVLIRIRDADLSVFERHSGHLPDELRAVVRRSLAQDPADRYQTASEFAEAIEDFVRHKRIALGAPRLVAWLTHAGLIDHYPSGEHAMDLRVRPVRSRKPPRPPSVAPPAEEASAPRAHQSSGASHGANCVAAAAGSAALDTSGHVSPAVYSVLIGERKIGRVPYARLVEFFATGKASADSLVSRSDGPFRPARELPELARILVSPALAEDPQAGDVPSDKWPLNRATHAQRLFDLALHRRTGLLTVSHHDRRKKLYFVDGAATFSTSTDRQELLGQQLIARGLALPIEIDMALALCPRYGGRLGDALVGLGVIRPVELFRALVAQTHDRILDLLRWQNGNLAFYHGLRAEGETILHGASALELVARGVLQGYRDSELVSLLTPCFDSDVSLAPNAESVLRSLRLPVRLGIVLDAIHRPQTLRSLLSICVEDGRAARDDVLRAVFIGLSVRALTSIGFPPDTCRPSVPTKRM
ncbi:MAG: protein kinase [Polyangiaceae bacterium]|nr:protein kinase [Polyangiaceae bacterium]